MGIEYNVGVEKEGKGEGHGDPSNDSMEDTELATTGFLRKKRREGEREGEGVVIMGEGVRKESRGRGLEEEEPRRVVFSQVHQKRGLFVTYL